MSLDTAQHDLIGYLSAVATELQRRGHAVTTIEHPHRDHRAGPLSATLALHPVCARGGVLRWSPLTATWHEKSGWSVQVSGTHSVTGRRYLHLALVPTPQEVAGFICGLASGHDLGMIYPVTFRSEDDDRAAAPIGTAHRFASVI